MTHSPEPWKAEVREHSGSYSNYDTIVDAEGKGVVWAEDQGYDGAFPDMMKVDAQRIAACVNALAGVPDEIVKRMSGGYFEDKHHFIMPIGKDEP